MGHKPREQGSDSKSWQRNNEPVHAPPWIQSEVTMKRIALVVAVLLSFAATVEAQWISGTTTDYGGGIYRHRGTINGHRYRGTTTNFGAGFYRHRIEIDPGRFGRRRYRQLYLRPMNPREVYGWGPAYGPNYGIQYDAYGRPHYVPLPTVIPEQPLYLVYPY